MNNKKIVLAILVASVVMVITSAAAVYYILNHYQPKQLQVKSEQQQKLTDHLYQKIAEKNEQAKQALENHDGIFSSHRFFQDSFFAEFDKVFDELNTMRVNMDKAFEQSMRKIYPEDSKNIVTSRFMVENNKDYYKVSAILQNVTKDMIKVTIEDRVLIINITEKQQKESKNSKSSKNTMITKMASLPKDVDESKATVTFKDGVLLIKMPKKEVEETKPLNLEVL